MSSDGVLTTARDIADNVLYPRALETDASDLLPKLNLDALAEAGLYGLAGPKEYGGAEIDLQSLGLVVEALAGACLTTAFVWIQHHRPVRALTESANASLRDRYLADLCAGRARAGVALGGMRDPAQLTATAVEGGWLLDGTVPWVSGWGRIDLLYATSRTPGGTPSTALVCALIDALESETLAVRQLRMVAANATGTVEARFSRHFVPQDRVVSTDPYIPAPAYDGGGRINGSLSLGIAARCCRAIGPGPLEDELAARRDQLDAATDGTMAIARAAATALALRSAAALCVHAGSSSLLLEHHPQRLMREAMFLLNFGTRPAIREHLLRTLRAT